ncbi:hypothetical protein AVEN_203921-1, partial [Araneus ventricosus]
MGYTYKGSLANSPKKTMRRSMGMVLVKNMSLPRSSNIQLME